VLAEHRRLAEGDAVSAIVGIADAAVIELTGTNGGPGAVTTFQGLLTNDLEKPGDAAFVYGALLTPKGMVVVDGWAARSGARVRFTTPVEGRERVLDILQKSVPPRLARFVDRSDESPSCGSPANTQPASWKRRDCRCPSPAGSLRST
jgi:glycine cleavage system aminomethyltransferase T